MHRTNDELAFQIRLWERDINWLSPQGKEIVAWKLSQLRQRLAWQQRTARTF
jgi:hypothetical protein